MPYIDTKDWEIVPTERESIFSVSLTVCLNSEELEFSNIYVCLGDNAMTCDVSRHRLNGKRYYRPLSDDESLLDTVKNVVKTDFGDELVKQIMKEEDN